jgi:hypothetical protein
VKENYNKNLMGGTTSTVSDNIFNLYE